MGSRVNGGNLLTSENDCNVAGDHGQAFDLGVRNPIQLLSFAAMKIIAQWRQDCGYSGKASFGVDVPARNEGAIPLIF